MPKRLRWDAAFAVGHEAVDAQHRDLVKYCNLLADHAVPVTPEAEAAFQQAFAALMALAREHFATEEAQLSASNHPDLEDYRHACEEFEYLAAEIATTENFDRIELQRFLALWLVGHILSDAKRAAAGKG